MKNFESLIVEEKELANLCINKINEGWGIEFVVPDSFRNDKVLFYKALISKDYEKEAVVLRDSDGNKIEVFSVETSDCWGDSAIESLQKR